MYIQCTYSVICCCIQGNISTDSETVTEHSRNGQPSPENIPGYFLSLGQLPSPGDPPVTSSPSISAHYAHTEWATRGKRKCICHPLYFYRRKIPRISIGQFRYKRYNKYYESFDIQFFEYIRVWFLGRQRPETWKYHVSVAFIPISVAI